MSGRLLPRLVLATDCDFPSLKSHVSPFPSPVSIRGGASRGLRTLVTYALVIKQTRLGCSDEPLIADHNAA